MPTIAALPYPYKFPDDPQVALLIIDMQRDFLEPGGFGEALGNDVSRLQAIVPTVQRLQQAFRDRNLPIIQTVEGHQPDLSDCPAAKRDRGRGQLRIGDFGPMGRILVLGEPGNQIVPELLPHMSETVIRKPGKGAFYKTELEIILQANAITHLIITGVTTEVCVQSTLREANDRGYLCLLVEDATESYFPEFKQATLAMVRSQDALLGWTATADQVLAGLSEVQAASFLSGR